jgi:FkbM family methyltransferase
MSSIKRWIARSFSNSVVSNWILGLTGGFVPDMRWKGMRFRLPKSGTSSNTASQIFFGFYEAAEIRLLERHMNSELNVIEFGSSLGVVSSHLARRMSPGTTLVCVEANRNLLDTATANVKRHAAEKVDWKIINRAVSTNGGTVRFSVSENHTASSMAKDGDCGIEVQSVSLSGLLRELSFKEFVLICDIEGMEIDLFKNDSIGFDGCQQLFIELHETELNGVRYSIDDLKTQVLSLGFRLSDRDGNVFYFNRMPKRTMSDERPTA